MELGLPRRRTFIPRSAGDWSGERPNRWFTVRSWIVPVSDGELGPGSARPENRSAANRMSESFLETVGDQRLSSLSSAKRKNTRCTTRSHRAPMNGNAFFAEAPTRSKRLLRSIARPRKSRTLTFSSLMLNAAAVSAVLNSSIFVRQRQDGLFQHPAKLQLRSVLLGIRRAVRWVHGRFSLVRAKFQRLRTVPFADARQRFMNDNSRQPRRKRRAVLELAQVLICAHARVLHDISRLIFVA
jgi:hypothetical protein